VAKPSGGRPIAAFQVATNSIPRLIYVVLTKGVQLDARNLHPTRYSRRHWDCFAHTVPNPILKFDDRLLMHSMSPQKV